MTSLPSMDLRSAINGRQAPGLLIAASFLACLLYLSRGITFDFWDGMLVLWNALSVPGLVSGHTRITVTRPPMDWLVLVPVAAPAYYWGGAAAAIKASHIFMCCIAAAFLLACHRIYMGLFPAWIAAAVTFLLAVNPLLVRYSPFLLFDIFGALAAIPFLWLGYRCVQEPSTPPYGWLLAAYLLAVLTRYQFALLILIPLAYGFIAPAGPGTSWGGRLKRLATSPLWLIPAAGYMIAFAGLSLLLAKINSEPAWMTARLMNKEFMEGIRLDLFAKPGLDSWLLYPFTLLEQLGPGLSLLAVMGVWRWLREGRPVGVYLTLALIVPLSIMNFLIPAKEQHYLLSFYPLIYAAVGNGLDWAWSELQGRSKTPWARVGRFSMAAALLLAVPWKRTAAMASWLMNEPALHTPMPARLAEVLETALPPEACIAWMPRMIVIPYSMQSGPRDLREPPVTLGAGVFPMFSRRKNTEIRQGFPLSCAPSVLIDPVKGLGFRHPEAYQPDAAPLARIYDWPGKRPRWDVYPLEVREVPRKSARLKL